MKSDNKLYAGAAVGLILAALAGFGVARMTGPSAPVAEESAAAEPQVTDTVEITPEGMKTSAIAVEAGSGSSLSGIVMASAATTDRMVADEERMLVSLT